MRRLAWLLALAACGGDDGGVEYEGLAGTPVPASFNDLVPEIEGTIDGGEVKKLLCDTGSPITFLDGPAFPGLADGKHQVALAAFALSFPDLDVASWDAFGGEAGPAGIIGGDLLRHFAFTLDYQGRRVWLDDPFDPAARPADVRAAVETRVAMDVRGGGTFRLDGDCSPAGCGNVRLPATRVVVQATFETQTTPVWVVVDSGASGVVLDAALLEALGDAGRRPRLDGAVFATVSGAVSGSHSRVWRVRLGTGESSVSVDDVPVMVAPAFQVLDGLSQEVGRPVRALVGGTLLRHFLTTLDYQSGELRLARYDAPTHIPDDEWVSVAISFQRDGDDWLAREVFEGRDAYQKGLRRGDVVEEIAGVPLRGQPGELIDRTLAGFELGEEVEVKYRRATTLETIRVLVEDLLPHYPPPA